ncbi:MAG: hypothetical protein IKR48_12445 [Kiritimatiellae bacterium]|nr:hypothetical protein [Kiritimatiellia bacterium]
MACFIVPALEAAAVTVIKKIVEKKEAKAVVPSGAGTDFNAVEKIPFSRKLGWLSNMLWGGSALLAFEHVWHGEVTPWFPFLTAVQEGPEAVSEMLGEMATAGVTMAILVTAVWCGLVAVSSAFERRARRAAEAAK